MLELKLKDKSRTLHLGSALGRIIENLKLQTFEIHLSGNLGAGKTTLVRGILRYLKWKDVVSSPSYTLCEEYKIEKRLLLHVDLYRINSSEDIEILNLDRKIDLQKVIVIEWPENLLTYRDANAIINLNHNEMARKASINCKDTDIESSIKTYYENTKS